MAAVFSHSKVPITLYSQSVEFFSLFLQKFLHFSYFLYAIRKSKTTLVLKRHAVGRAVDAEIRFRRAL